MPASTPPSAGVDVTFEALPATAVADHGPFDAVIVLETLHDIAHPVDALLAWRRALARGGAVVVADEKVADRFTAPGDETERFMYGFSVLHCLPSSMATPDSAALGTVLRAATVHELTADGGLRPLRRDRRRRRVLPHLRAHPVSTHTRPPTRPTRSTP